VTLIPFQPVCLKQGLPCRSEAVKVNHFSGISDYRDVFHSLLFRLNTPL
jgi:hypothetical protein